MRHSQVSHPTDSAPWIGHLRPGFGGTEPALPEDMMTNTKTYRVVSTAQYGRVTMEHVLGQGLTIAKARKLQRMHGGRIVMEGQE